jgi:hypothetical protein
MMLKKIGIPILSNLGLSLKKIKQSLLAKTAYEIVKELEPWHGKANYGLVDCLIDLG